MANKKILRKGSVKKKRGLSFSEYKRSLELATAGMVEILDINRLIRLIVYMIVKKVGLVYAGILLYDDKRKSYVLTSSRGKTGSVIPKEYIRIEADEPIIRFFSQRKNYLINRSGAVSFEDLNGFLKKKKVFDQDKDLKKSILELRDEMVNYEVEAFVPGYYQTKNLIGILFLGKRIDKGEFGQDELEFFMALTRTAVMAIRNAQLYQNIQKIFYGVIQAMALSIEKFDPDFTRPHMDRIFKMGGRVIEKLEKRGVEFPGIPRELFLSSIFLHDIGKQYTPREILYKEAPLDDKEWEILRRHPVDGADIFDQIEGLEDVADIIRYHQEKFDGTGYPEGMKGYEIPLGARIAAVLDSFDAMTHARPYRKKPLIVKDATLELIKNKNRQFDPELVDTFVEVLVEEGVLTQNDLKDLGSDSSIQHLFDRLIFS